MVRGRARSSRAVPGAPAVAAALVLSGAAGLIDEVVWIRRSALAFGATVYAMSTVLAAFFLGLAVGGWAFGRFAQRRREPLRDCARLEIALAALALASLPALAAADAVFARLYRALPAESGALAAARAGLVAIVLLPPALLMGGTLPLVVRARAREPARVGAAIARLYGLNTAGAAAGALLAGLVLIPAIGMRAAMIVAAASNVGAALLLARAPRQDLAPERQALDRSAVAPSVLAVVSLVVFACGLVALGEEVLWARFLALVVHGSVRTTTITLALVLAGIVTGSLLVVPLADRSRSRAFWLGAFQVAHGVLAWTLLMLPAAWWQRGGGEVPVAAALLLPPAVLSGAAFPLAVRTVVAEPRWAGIGIGRMAAINTAGGIAGALLTGFLLLPGSGLEASARLLTGIALAAGLLTWAFLARAVPIAARLVPAAAAVAAWLAVPALTHTRLPADFLAAPGRLVDVREGLEANLAVVRGPAGEHVLEIDRWWQGQDRKTHQIMAAHLPMLLHLDPRRVLVVGVGAGQTPMRFALHPLERLDCVDIEPRVFDLVRAHFASAWMRDPRVRLLRTDGRIQVANGPGAYDIVSLEVGQLSRPGVASFYTLDFYRRAAARLRPGGIVSQFVALPFLSPRDLRDVVATFLAAFPHATLWYNTSELLLVGSIDRLPRLEAARVHAVLADPTLAADLRYSPWGGPEAWLSRPEALAATFLCGPAGLRRLAAGGEVQRDDRPRLEYAASRVREEDLRELACIPAIRACLDSIGTGAPGLQAAAAREAERLREENLADLTAAADLRVAGLLLERGDAAAAAERIRHGIEAHPGNAVAWRTLGGVEMMLADGAAAADAFARALAISPADARAQGGLGMLALQQGNDAEAAGRLRTALALDPADPELHNALGAALGRLGDPHAALAEFDRALALDPAYPEARRNADQTRGALRDSSR